MPWGFSSEDKPVPVAQIKCGLVCVCVCAGALRAPSGCVEMGIKAALPKYEIYFYNTVLCLAMFWSASWVFEVSSCEYEHAHTQIHTHTH